MSTGHLTVTVSVRGSKWVEIACRVAKIMAHLRLPAKWCMAVVNLGMGRMEYRVGQGRWRPLGYKVTRGDLGL